MRDNILVVEDDTDINNLLCEILEQNGYTVTPAYSGTEAKLLSKKETFSLILLDLMLPGLAGEQLIPIFRITSNAPIIILSAKQTPTDKVNALKSGADDYITKPFSDEELLARIEAHLRRAKTTAGPAGAPKLYHRDLVMDIQARTVANKKGSVTLTGREFDILQLLLTYPNKVFTKANIYSSVWQDEFFGDDKTLSVHMSNLRTKLGSTEYIQTVWGIGFKMADNKIIS